MFENLQFYNLQTTLYSESSNQEGPCHNFSLVLGGHSRENALYVNWKNGSFVNPKLRINDTDLIEDLTLLPLEISMTEILLLDKAINKL